jgi:hypothetical protein
MGSEHARACAGGRVRAGGFELTGVEPGAAHAPVLSPAQTAANLTHPT